MEGAKDLDPDDKRTRTLEELVRTRVRAAPAEEFKPSLGQEILLAGKRMFLVTRSGGHTYGERGSSSLGRVSIMGIVDKRRGGGFAMHGIDGLDMFLERALEDLDPSSVRLKQLRETATIPKNTFLGPDLLDLPPRIADSRMVLQHGVYQQIHKAVLDELEGTDLSGKNVLDLGCGRGDLLARIRKAHPGANVYGLEYFRQNVECARNRLAMAGPGTDGAVDRVVEGDAKKLGSKFEGVRFHVIVATGLLNHQTSSPRDARMMLGQWPGKLHPGAKVVLSGFTPIVLDPQDFEGAGITLKKTCLPKNLFGYEEPKELFVGEYTGSDATRQR